MTFFLFLINFKICYIKEKRIDKFSCHFSPIKLLRKNDIVFVAEKTFVPPLGTTWF